MSTAIVVIPGREVSPLLAKAGEKGRRRFVEFFTAKIENPNTRDAYARDVRAFFAWCEDHGLESSPVSSRFTSPHTATT